MQGTRFELAFNGKKPSVSPVGLISKKIQEQVYKESFGLVTDKGEKKYKNRFIKNPLDWLQIKE